MRVKLPECHLFTRQAKAGSEANIHEASFIERRLFYLSHPNVFARSALSFCDEAIPMLEGNC